MDSHRLNYWLFDNQQPSHTTAMYEALPVLTSDKTTSPTLSDLEAPFEYHDPLITPMTPSSYPPYTTYQPSLYAPLQESLHFSAHFPPTPTITEIDSEDISPPSSPMLAKVEPLSIPLSSIPTASASHKSTDPQPEKHATSARRRAQNRRAQRAFRERKERHAKELEEKLMDLTTKYHALEREHEQLERAYRQLSEGKSRRKTAAFEGE